MPGRILAKRPVSAHLRGGVEGDLDHLVEAGLALLGRELLLLEQVVGDRADAQGALAPVGRGGIEGGGLHLDGLDAHAAQGAVAVTWNLTPRSRAERMPSCIRW